MVRPLLEEVVTLSSFVRPMSSALRTVLVVEDASDVRELFAVVLQEAGYRVECAESVQEALSMLRTGRVVDVMVADYEAEWPALGFGSWTVTERASGTLVGLGGLRVHEGEHGVALRAAFTPEAQGKGYGPELGRGLHLRHPLPT